MRATRPHYWDGDHIEELETLGHSFEYQLDEVYHGGKYTAAVFRASRDLTRELAKFRR